MSRRPQHRRPLNRRALNRRQLLAGLAGGLGGLPLWSALTHAATGTDRFLLVHWNAGGWDPTYVFDPHFDSRTIDGDPQATLAEVGGISFADAASRPAVRSFFEQHAARTAIVNGIAVGSISHQLCTQLMLTGSRLTTAADIQTLVAASTGSALALPSVVLSGPRYPGTLGEVMVPLSPVLTGTVNRELPADRPISMEAEARARAYLSQVAGGLEGEMFAQYARGVERLETLTQAQTPLEIPEDATADELLSAGLQALQSGLSRCLTIAGTLPERVFWDSHQGNALAQEGCYEHLFTELTDILALLESTTLPDGGTLLERTCVLVLSEMGRMPVLNAGEGKDHWPYTSAMLIGAGVAGGQVVGATSDLMEGLPIDLTSGAASDSGEIATPSHLIAGLLAAFGVDPGEWVPGVTPLTAPFGG